MKETGRAIIWRTETDSTGKLRSRSATGGVESPTLPKRAIVTMTIIVTTMIVTGGTIIAR